MIRRLGSLTAIALAALLAFDPLAPNTAYSRWQHHTLKQWSQIHLCALPAQGSNEQPI